jgi:hypothetical protein
MNMQQFYRSHLLFYLTCIFNRFSVPIQPGDLALYYLFFSKNVVQPVTGLSPVGTLNKQAQTEVTPKAGMVFNFFQPFGIKSRIKYKP